MFLEEKSLYGEQVVVQREGLLGTVLAKPQLSCVAWYQCVFPFVTY